VEAIKLNRQNLIAVVEKIVEEKSKELVGKQGNHFSWLVFKLNNKIYDLRAKIEAKDKAIREITFSKESEMVRQKETEIECLNEIIQFAKD
jgi:FAD synthase